MTPEELSRRLHQTADRLSVSPPPEPPAVMPTAGAGGRAGRGALLAAAAGIAVVLAIAGTTYALTRPSSSGGHYNTLAAATDSNAPSTTAPVSTSAAPSTSATASDSSTRSGTSTAATTACSPDAVTVKVVDQIAFSGHQLAILAVTNNAAAPCTVSGYPTVSVLDGNGDGVDATPVYSRNSDVYSGASDAPVTIAPGDAAGLYIGRLTDPSGTCDPVLNAQVAVLLNSSDKTPVDTPVSVGLCPGGRFLVSPFQPDTSEPAIP